MLRKLTIVTAVLAASFAARSAMAQASTSTSQKPAAAPAAKPAPTAASKSDTATKHAVTTASAKKSSTTHHWTKEQIKEAQEGLAKAGFYQGQATGVMDAKTEKALKEYQKKEKLPVTGHLSDSVLVKLKSA